MSLLTRIKRLEVKAAPVVDVAAILNAARLRNTLGIPHPPSEPIPGTSPLAKALRAARKRCGITT